MFYAIFGVIFRLIMEAPFGYIGGKKKLAEHIVKLFPEYKLYVEVFGGSLSVLYEKPKTLYEVVNDIDKGLINLHKVIQYHPQTLSNYLKENIRFVSRELYEDFRDGVLKGRNNIEKAAIYYYVLVQSFGYKKESFAMSSKVFRTPVNIHRSFLKYSKRLKGVTIENMSFSDILDKYDGRDTFFYLDPPYYGTEKHYKGIAGSFTEHGILCEKLKGIAGLFLLSYNDCSVIRKLYQGLNIINTGLFNYSLNGNISPNSVTELLITNYSLPKKQVFSFI